MAMVDSAETPITVNNVARSLPGWAGSAAESANAAEAPQMAVAPPLSSPNSTLKPIALATAMEIRIVIATEPTTSATGCTYSLYFFPEVVPDIARVLRPGGALVALTHSERSFAGLLRAIGVEPEGSGLQALIRRFSAESGTAQLEAAFGEVARIDYGNLLHFYAGDAEALAAYVQFKMPLICDDGDPGSGEATDLVAEARRTLKRLGWVKIEKDDAAFICRRPR